MNADDDEVIALRFFFIPQNLKLPPFNVRNVQRPLEWKQNIHMDILVSYCFKPKAE